jgi:hypothetical protein
MDLVKILGKLDAIGAGRSQLNEASKEDMEYYFGKDKKDSKPAGEKETGTGHMAKKTDKGTQYTKKDLPGQDTSKDSDTKTAEKRAKKKASEDIAELLQSLNRITESTKEVDEEKTEEGNEFSGALAKAKAAGAKEFEVDGKKYQVKESEDEESEDEEATKETVEESQLDEKAAPGQEDWIKSNKARFIKQYGKEKGLEVLYATAWKRSKKQDESRQIEECYDQAMGAQEESGMNINASTDTRTGHKSLTVTAQGQAAEQLAQLLKLSGVGASTAHDAEMEEAYANTPEPEVQGMEVQMSQGTDLNRPKSMHQHSYRQGDNPMAMREAEELAAIERRLTEALAEFKVVAEAKGKKPDFLDMDKDGDKKEPMKKALKDKAKK